MGRKLDYTKKRRRRRDPTRLSEPEVRKVHPNSTAARVWGRTSWTYYHQS